jgi:predicted RND superfamily exporter protein
MSEPNAMIETGQTADKRFLYRLGEQLIERRKIVLIGVAAVTLVFAAFALQLDLVTRFDEQLPQTHEFIQTHNEYAATVGGANTLQIMLEVKDGNIFNQETLTKVFEMTKRLDTLYGINHDLINSLAHRTNRRIQLKAGGLTEIEPIMDRAPQNENDVKRVRDIVYTTPNLYGVLVSLDEKATLLQATFVEGRIDHQRLFDEVMGAVVEPFSDDNTVIHIAGQPALYGWVYYYGKQVYWIFLATTVLMWILLYLYFHDVRGALRPTITGVISAIWGLGFIKMIGFSLDPLTLVIPFFITARAVSHSVQMHERYYEEYQKAQWQKEPAIIASFAELFVPTLSGILTDALGVLVILLVPIVLLQKLAISAAVWILAITVSELLLNPIVYYYLREPDVRIVMKREEGIFKRIVSSLASGLLSPAGKALTLASWVGLVIGSVYFWQHLVIGDPSAISPLLYKDSPYNTAHARIQETFGGVENLMIIAERQLPQGDDASEAGLTAMEILQKRDSQPSLMNPEVLPWIEKFQRYLERDPAVGASFSFVDILGAVNATGDPKWSVLPQTRSQVLLAISGYFFGVSYSESARILDYQFRYAPIHFFLSDHKGDTVRRVIKRAREYITANPLETARFRLAGGPIGVLAAANEELLQNDIMVNLLGFGTIFIILVVTYRSIMAGVYMILPLLVANMVINAYMGARDIGINIHTLPVVTVGVGFGIDYALYIVSRIIEEQKPGETLESAVLQALVTSGKAVAFTAITMILGTLFWTMSSLRFSGEMGLLLALWMGVSFLATVTLLPVLVALFKPRFVTSRIVTPAAESVPA